MYQLIDQNNVGNAILPFNGDGRVNYSMLHELNSPVNFKGFSIKYVHEGLENYVVNGRRYSVNQGEYILGNSFSEGSANIGSSKLVKGTCININSDILSEVVASVMRPDSSFPDQSLDRFFNSRDFYENKYSCKNTCLGSMLVQTAARIDQSPAGDFMFTKQYYYEMCEKIVLDHLHLFSQISSISAVKSVTRKELFRRAELGKEFIDINFSTDINVAQVAKYAGLSEYHFFRLFRSIFKTSPHHYIVRKRLEASLLLIKIQRLSIAETAIRCGFSDASSFSKSFKKNFGYPPSQLHIN